LIYLNENDIETIGIDWHETIDVIENVVKRIEKLDYAQPIKPYLRYKDFKNRIIAMPAFVGRGFNIAGIKWISSFPENITKNIPRAHSVVVLNHADTGVPIAVINTSLLSVIRTASVSGLLIRYFDKIKSSKELKLGIIGWGPIGQYHFKMCTELLGNRLKKISIYDLKTIDNNSIDYPDKDSIHIRENWEQVYDGADILITCTVSKEPYIDKRPKEGALLLNVSLRDYCTDIYDFVKNSIIVDDWDEVCREKTDIEMMHKERGLLKENTWSIVDVVCGNCLVNFKNNETVMFNPMGMAVFDIAIGKYYFDKAREMDVGQLLD
jgi:2,3-diaminopropionate biosynthesis protein SbnB